MNKLMTAALIAGGLLLLDAPDAAAHKEVRNVQQPSAYYRVETRRKQHMPNWLKRNRSFRTWFRHTGLRKYRRLSWHQLFDIYRWERVAARQFRHGAGHFDDHGYYGKSRRSDRQRRAR